MARAKLVANWDLISSIVTTVINVNSSKKTRRMPWHGFNPWRNQRNPNLIPFTPENIHVLKALVDHG